MGMHICRPWVRRGSDWGLPCRCVDGGAMGDASGATGPGAEASGE